MGHRISHLVLGAVAVAPAGAWTSAALAQNYTVQSITKTGSAGTLTASNSTATTLTLAPGGSFSPVGYQRAATTMTYKVVVQCANHGSTSCSTTGHFIAVMKDSAGVVAGSRILPLDTFTVGNQSVSVSGPTGSPSTWTFGGMANSGTATFQVGFNVPLATSGTTGSTVTRTFSVAVGASSTTSTMTSTMSAIVWNPMAASVTSDMDFGRIVKPNAGSGTVTLTPTGVTTSAGVVLGAAHSAAGFNITGEGGQAFSLTVPASFVMTSGAHSLTVTTTPSVGGGMTTQQFSGSLSVDGSFPFTVGGLMPISSSTASGAYTGNLVISVQYN